MNNYINKIKFEISEWKKEIWRHKWLILASLIMITIADYVNYDAGKYVDKFSSLSTSDIILNSLSVINLSFLFIYGFYLINLVLILYPLFFEIKKLHIAISQLSFLVLIRSFFVILTHLNAPTGAIFVEVPKFIKGFYFQNDLFFSGHVAIPFLGFLLFRRNKIKYFFIIATIVMMFTVLAMHVHYSIDVFAALFIAYGSYRIGEIILNITNNKNEKT